MPECAAKHRERVYFFSSIECRRQFLDDPTQYLPVHRPLKVNWNISPLYMDHLHYRLIFDLNKSRQKVHHSLKEHHKISNIPKFRCEML